MLHHLDRRLTARIGKTLGHEIFWRVPFDQRVRQAKGEERA
jgi:hypothetical protein